MTRTIARRVSTVASSYYDAPRTAGLPTALIQGLRDYFGARTYPVQTQATGLDATSTGLDATSTGLDATSDGGPGGRPGGKNTRSSSTSTSGPRWSSSVVLPTPGSPRRRSRGCPSCARAKPRSPARSAGRQARGVTSAWISRSYISHFDNEQRALGWAPEE